MINESSLIYKGILDKTKNQNNDNIDFTLRQLVLNLAIMAYEYNGMPDEIPVDIMEEMLFFNGSVVFFEIGGHAMALPAVADASTLNVYGLPISYKPYGLNGAQFNRVFVEDFTFINNEEIVKNEANGVLVWNSIDGISTYQILKPILNRLNYIWQSIGITEALSRAKLLFLTSQNSKNSVQKELKRLFDNIDPIVAITDKGMTDSFERVDTGVNANDIQPLWYDFDKTFSLLLTCFGFNSNAEPTKKARLNVAEVESNNEIIETMRESGLNYRKKAFEKVNKIFGTSIEVKMRGEEEVNEEYDENFNDDEDNDNEETI